MTDASHDRRIQRQRERRARKQEDHVTTRIIAALGAGEIEDWRDEQDEDEREG